MLSYQEKRLASKRPRSTPPISKHEFGPRPDDRLDLDSKLQVDAALLRPYAEAVTLLATLNTTVILLDKKYILKLLPSGQDIHETVAIMRLASTAIPVPHVYDYGYSGNCSFIRMEYVVGFTLDAYIRYHGRQLSTSPQVLQQIDNIVASLARLDISHNDLYPRNIIVDDYLCIISVVDWDGAAPWHNSQEYTRRVRFGTVVAECVLKDEPWLHDWDHIFRRYCPDAMECCTSWKDLRSLPWYLRRRKDPWTGFWRPDHWPGLLPWLAPERTAIH
ncbi:hypothetical protein CERSUDRAFT_111511 [Gelatoporia subvermispora B]|uniref:Protein kinase domain-containing protein n=1 Tax=Ceriporiopsis subvermispora (strain B) TaxID=914234 RepID=M2PVZ1_CERS8|nr:hypothetical protein CERSUDRAFT_111511 [Gelatoporia subvermispora B]